MSLEMLPIWIAALLGIGMLGVVALRLIFAPENAQDRARAARIKALTEGHHAGQAEALVRDLGRDRIGRSLPFVGNLTLLLRRAGHDGRGWLIVAIAGAAASVLAAGFSLSMPIWAAVPLALLICLKSTLAYLRGRHQKRVERLTSQLPDALDLMMRGLRVGHPISATIANVARTMPDPIGHEFQIIAEQIAHGDFLTDAFKDFAERAGQEDVEYLAVAIGIQHGTGGNLADMLGTLAAVVRDRIVMRRRVRAISSEGRLSAMLLSALPVVIYLSTTFTAPDYYSGVSDDPLFKPLMITIVLLVVANFLALRRLVTFQL